MKIIAIVIAFLVSLYFLFGIMVIQPIGLIPNGITIVYVRVGLNLNFIDSPDGVSMRVLNGKVSLLSRGLALGSIGETIKDRIVLRLPYSEELYKISINHSD